MRLKKYAVDSWCSKCGSIGAQVRFMADNNDKFGPGKLRRECNVCGYIWYERPLDAEEK